MDTERVEELGLVPLQALLGEVAAVGSVDALGATLGRLHRVGVTGTARPLRQPRPTLSRGLRGLPGASRSGPAGRVVLPRGDVCGHSRRLRHAPRAASRVGGHSRGGGQGSAHHGPETGLALHHWDQVANRDAVKTYNAFTLDQAEALAPEFPWHTWFSAMEAPEGSIEKVVVRQPSFVTGLGRS